MKFTTLFLTFVLLALMSMGQFVSRDEAFSAANNFYVHKAAAFDMTVKSQDLVKEDLIMSPDGNPCMYIFNYKDGGYILMGADKRAVPVLAYSFEGSLNIADMAPATNSWLQSYIEQYDLIIEQNIESTPRLAEMWESASKNTLGDAKNIKGVSTLCETRWNQNSPYNYFCPEHSAGPSGKVYAGCVATAMAQVMKYWNYPEIGRGTAEYFWGDYFEVDFGATTYQWDNMPNSIHTYSDTLNKKAIAELIFHCGVSVDMNYGHDGSGASTSDAFFAMKQNFRYRAGMFELSKSQVEDSTWKLTLKEDLDLGHPILYRGVDEGSNGHAFVCDGYQDTSYFHFNWGWGGSADGYYYLDNINPQMSFHFAQGAILNITPNYAEYCNSMVYTQNQWSFHDGSGPNYYFNNQDCDWLIDLSGHEFDFVRMTFTKFETLEGDVLKIYEGNSENGELIGTYTELDMPSEIISYSDNIYFTFETNGEGQADGWEVVYETVVLDVEDNVLSEIILYPNPAQDIITVDGIEEKANLRIVDLAGREYISNSNFENGTIEIANLAAGVYIIQITNENETKTLKFIKEK